MSDPAPIGHQLEIQKLMEKIDQGGKDVQKSQTLVSWSRDDEAEDGLDAKANTAHVFTSVSLSSSVSKVIRPDTEFRLFGVKIDIDKARVEKFKEDYKKSAAGTITHNFIMARFSEFKLNALGFMLSMAGIPPEEIQALKKAAIEEAGQDAAANFKENEMNGELLKIVGGKKREVAAQENAIKEIREQLLAQLKNAGLGHLYTPEKLLELRVGLCQEIREQFVRERDLFVYQKEFYTAEKL